MKYFRCQDFRNILSFNQYKKEISTHKVNNPTLHSFWWWIHIIKIVKYNTKSHNLWGSHDDPYHRNRIRNIRISLSGQGTISVVISKTYISGYLTYTTVHNYPRPHPKDDKSTAQYDHRHTCPSLFPFLSCSTTFVI